MPAQHSNVLKPAGTAGHALLSISCPHKRSVILAIKLRVQSEVVHAWKMPLSSEHGIKISRVCHPLAHLPCVFEQRGWLSGRQANSKSTRLAPATLATPPTPGAQTETWMLLEYCDKGTLQVSLTCRDCHRTRHTARLLRCCLAWQQPSKLAIP